MLTYIEEKQLLWYKHVRKTSEHKLIKKIIDWSSTGRRKRGRSRHVEMKLTQIWSKVASKKITGQTDIVGDLFK